jgi:hypothetical protein
LTRPVALPKILAQMPVTIPSAALRQMTEDERRHVLGAAFDSSPEALANYLAVLDARLRVFERRYELPTSALRDALGSGKLRDTAEVSEWMFLAELRSDLAREARPQPAR